MLSLNLKNHGISFGKITNEGASVASFAATELVIRKANSNAW